MGFSAVGIAAVGALVAGMSAYAVDPAQRGSQNFQAMLAPNIQDRGNDLPGSSLQALSIDLAKRASGAQAYPLPSLERVDLRMGQAGSVLLSELPQFNTLFEGRVASLTSRNEFVFYTVRPDLQEFAAEMVRTAKTSHVAFVALEPQSGKILAIAGKSSALTHPELHAGFPAASLFKIVTSTAAVERAGLSPETMIGFRGGTYTLNEWNYDPNTGRNTRVMSLADALGKSCNPVFSRVALRFLNPEVLRSYARAFGFNSDLRFDLPLPPSAAKIPDNDFELGRTAAGFGAVTFSPIHAASVMGGIANRGVMLRPALIDSVITQSGAVLYQQRPQALTRLMNTDTSRTILDMMERTTTIGTSRRAFTNRNAPIFPDIPVAAKTGTLKGQYPEGINNWFVAAAPSDNPRIALAVLVVHPQGHYLTASQLGRQFLQKFFNRPVSALQAAPVRKFRSAKPLKRGSVYLKKKKVIKKRKR